MKQSFSSSKEPSTFCTIPVLEYLQESWGNMANHPKFAEVEGPLHKGIENLEKWYHKVNDTNAYFICLGVLALSVVLNINRLAVLDPNVKNPYAQDKWDEESYSAGVACLETVV